MMRLYCSTIPIFLHIVRLPVALCAYGVDLPYGMNLSRRSSLVVQNFSKNKAHASTYSEPNVQYRMANEEDIRFARKTLLANAMNPLSISGNSLLCAYDAKSNELLGFGQVRPLDDGEWNELASLYVLPEYRSLGIGSAIVTNLLNRFDERHELSNSSVCLLTLRPTIQFYERFRFCVVDKDNVPPPLKFELTAGTLISSILGNDIVCMVRS